MIIYVWKIVNKMNFISILKQQMLTNVQNHVRKKFGLSIKMKIINVHNWINVQQKT